MDEGVGDPKTIAAKKISKLGTAVDRTEQDPIMSSAKNKAGEGILETAKNLLQATDHRGSVVRVLLTRLVLCVLLSRSEKGDWDLGRIVLLLAGPNRVGVVRLGCRKGSRWRVRRARVENQ